MRALSKLLAVLTASAALISCGGGGGGSGNGGIANPPTAKLEVTAGSSTSTPFSLVPVTVRATGANNAALPDGTAVTLRVSTSTLGLVSYAEPGIGPTEEIEIGEVVQGELSGGAVNFRLHTRAVGNATITASINNPSAPGQTVTANTAVNIQAGAGTDPRLTLDIENPTIPLRPANVPFFFPSPYESLVTVTQRRLDGSLVNGSTDQGGGGGDEHCNGGSGAAAAIGTGLDSGALFLPAEGIEDEDDDGIPEYFFCRSVSLGMNSGKHDFYVVSFDEQGEIELSVTAEDPQTSETLSRSFTFNVGGVPQLPASIVITSDGRPVYITGTNGLHSAALEIAVLDGLGTPVPNPAPGVNNVRLEIVDGGQGGERLRGLNANGGVVQGNVISVPSSNGRAPAQFDAGSVVRIARIRATTDRADNNVDNGIQDPLVSEIFTIPVTDGRVHSVQIEDIYDVAASGNAEVTVIGATYGLTISAKLQDKFGQAVPAGTQVTFGVVDEPQQNGVFLNAGNDGNPQELGTLFTAPTGRFISSAGGPAGQNAVTLLVFAENDPANFDMESARNITSVQSDTQLTVGYRFNANDGDNPGTSFDATNLPYIIGRARDASYVARTAQTNEDGVARAVLIYPRSQLGKRIAIYAQANGEVINGTAELVTDVEFARFQGEGPLQVTSPSAILGNRTERFDVCVLDATATGIAGATVEYAVSIPATVNGSTAATGTIPGVTGANGCIEVVVTTSGLTQTGTAGEIQFTVDNAEPAITEITGPTSLLLTANPSAVQIGLNNPGAFGISLRLVDGTTGQGIPGVTITANCTPTPPYTLAGQPGPTNSNGTSNVQVNFTQPAVPGSCTFTTATGQTVTVPITPGVCGGISPPPPGC